MSLRTEISELPDVYLDCRRQHVWKFVRAYYVGAGKGQLIVVKSVCRCGATATDTYRSNGQIEKPRTIDYTNAEGYLVVGHGRIERSEFRREWISRLDIEPRPRSQ